MPEHERRNTAITVGHAVVAKLLTKTDPVLVTIIRAGGRWV